MGRYDRKEEERTLLLTPPELNRKRKGRRSWIVEGFSRAVTRERKWIRAQRMGEKDSRATDGEERVASH